MASRTPRRAGPSGRLQSPPSRSRSTGRRRGRLSRLTPFCVALYACRQVREGRRFAGTTVTDAMSEAAQRRHGFRVVSMDQETEPGERRPMRLGESLADRDSEDPFDVVRREHDYPAVLEMEDVADNALRTFEYLAETKSAGVLRDLAAELNVSPGRVTQLKRVLAEAMHKHGYAGALGRRPTSADGATKA